MPYEVKEPRNIQEMEQMSYIDIDRYFQYLKTSGTDLDVASQKKAKIQIVHSMNMINELANDMAETIQQISNLNPVIRLMYLQNKLYIDYTRVTLYLPFPIKVELNHYLKLHELNQLSPNDLNYLYNSSYETYHKFMHDDYAINELIRQVSSPQQQLWVLLMKYYHYVYLTDYQLTRRAIFIKRVLIKALIKYTRKMIPDDDPIYYQLINLLSQRM